jgi:phosphatidylinositol alpha 1,6-mannosyltransferase
VHIKKGGQMRLNEPTGANRLDGAGPESAGDGCERMALTEAGFSEAQRSDAPVERYPAEICAKLRVALFTGNYNYIKDGVSLTLNRLVDYLQRQGVAVLIVAPTGPAPAFEPVGELLSVPSFPIPSRPEYRLSLGLPAKVRCRLEEFRPTLFHIAVPDLLGYRALCLAERWQVPVVASYHTRYDTYLKYYGLSALEGLGKKYLRHFYGRCRRLYPPSESMAAILREEGIAQNMQVWSRGVDTERFNPSRRDLAWRRSLGIADDDVVVTYVGRLVKEKNTALLTRVFGDLKRRGIRFRPMVVGNGPEEAGMRAALPDGIFTGFLNGEPLACAYASSDVFVFPSESETFGNVTLEAMASGLPAVCADASGSRNLVVEGVTGFLVSARDEPLFIDRIATLVKTQELRVRMSAHALQRSAEFRWDNVLSGLLASYIDVVAQSETTVMGTKALHPPTLRAGRDVPSGPERVGSHAAE